MSTLKSDGIQPTLTTNNLIIRSGADVERLRIQPDGQILVASTTGTTFAGEVNFSNTIRIPGGVQVGGGIGPTRYTALDVVHTNTGLGLPDAVNYNTTRSRSNMMIQASGTSTTLFFGNNSSTHAWLQVQNSDNNPYGLMLNPAGGSVIVGSFGGDTNVMAKPTNSNLTVGQVVPIFTWFKSATPSQSVTPSNNYNNSPPLPSGTWFVYWVGIAESNSSGGNSENISNTMAGVWTVPANKWLVFAHNDRTLGSAVSSDNSGMSYKEVNETEKNTIVSNGTSAETITAANSWTILSYSEGNAEYIHTRADPTTTATKRFVYHPSYNPALHVSGYAIRIA